MSESRDLVVVGAGPAGMAAAATALDGGLRVALVDSGAAPGGQFWRHPPLFARKAVPTADLHHGLSTYRALCATLAAYERTGRLALLLNHHVWTTARDEDGFAVHAMDRGRAPEEKAVVLRAPALLVATGAYDRQLPFPGWDLPGVLTAGGSSRCSRVGESSPAAGWSSAARAPSCCRSPPRSPHAGRR